jgi:hypothetical protein
MLGQCWVAGLVLTRGEGGFERLERALVLTALPLPVPEVDQQRATPIGRFGPKSKVK